jgi:hypothetical protein
LSLKSIFHVGDLHRIPVGEFSTHAPVPSRVACTTSTAIR